MKLSQNFLRHQIEFISGYIILRRASTNYPVRIHNFFCLAVSGGFIFLWGVPQIDTNCVFQGGKTIKFQHFDAMQRKTVEGLNVNYKCKLWRRTRHIELITFSNFGRFSDPQTTKINYLWQSTELSYGDSW